jgi:hypothetical protein
MAAVPAARGDARDQRTLPAQPGSVQSRRPSAGFELPAVPFRIDTALPRRARGTGRATRRRWRRKRINEQRREARPGRVAVLQLRSVFRRGDHQHAVVGQPASQPRLQPGPLRFAENAGLCDVPAQLYPAVGRVDALPAGSGRPAESLDKLSRRHHEAVWQTSPGAEHQVGHVRPRCARHRRHRRHRGHRGHRRERCVTALRRNFARRASTPRSRPGRAAAPRTG